MYCLKKYTLFLIILIFAACQKDEPPTPLYERLPNEAQQLQIDELNELLYPIDGAAPVLPPEALAPLDRYTDSRIIALGEATHGSREFFQMKDRIFRYLVEEKGFRAIAFEMDFTEALYFNDYVENGVGDLDKLMREKMIFWTWRTSEVRDMLHWMKAYNEGKPAEEKIRFYGFDCQYSLYNADQLISRLYQINTGLSDFAIQKLSDFKKLNYTDSKNLTAEERQLILSDITSVLDTVIASRPAIEAGSSVLEYLLTEQLARNILQTEEVIWSYNNNISTNFRDRYMAENALWIADYIAPDAKIVLWAHNAHVANNPGYGTTGSMGADLAKVLGNDYRIVGFSFGRGRFTAVTPGTGPRTHHIDKSPLSTSLNFLFSHASADAFWFFLDDAETSSLWKDWLSEPQPFLMIGSSYNGNSTQYYESTYLPLHYDVLIHFNETHQSELLN